LIAAQMVLVNIKLDVESNPTHPPNNMD